MRTDHWVAYNQCPKSNETEIAIIRVNFLHGFKSWGWDHPNRKIIILSGKYNKKIINLTMKHAKLIANALNKSESL